MHLSPTSATPLHDPHTQPAHRRGRPSDKADVLTSFIPISNTHRSERPRARRRSPAKPETAPGRPAKPSLPQISAARHCRRRACPTHVGQPQPARAARRRVISLTAPGVAGRRPERCTRAHTSDQHRRRVPTSTWERYVPHPSDVQCPRASVDHPMPSHSHHLCPAQISLSAAAWMQ